MWKTKNAFRHLEVKSEEKRPLERHRIRWEDNIKTDLGKITLDGEDWI
jgi:hypothetical protein